MMADTPEVETEGTELAEVKTFDEAYVKELRGEAAKHRTEKNVLKKQVEELDAKVKGFTDANKSEIEKITERATAAETALADKDREIAEGRVKTKVLTSAAKLNIVDPDAAYLLLDLNSVDPEDAGSIDKALKALVKEKPYLLRGSAPPTPGVGQKPVKGKASPDQQFADMLKGTRK